MAPRIVSDTTQPVGPSKDNRDRWSRRRAARCAHSEAELIAKRSNGPAYAERFRESAKLGFTVWPSASIADANLIVVISFLSDFSRLLHASDSFGADFLIQDNH